MRIRDRDMNGRGGQDFPRRRRPDDIEEGYERRPEGGEERRFEGRECGRRGNGEMRGCRGPARGEHGPMHGGRGFEERPEGFGHGPMLGCHGFEGRPEGFGHGPMRGRRMMEIPQDDSLGSLIMRCFRELRHGGSAATQRKILVILSQTGETPQRALQELLGVRPGSMSEVLGKLESKGLIERTRSGMDRRSAMLKITEEGRKLASEGPAEDAELFSALSDEEQETLRGLLKKALGEGVSPDGEESAETQE
ncbi:MAG: MarR family transcriptional regulator [Firmicutes bacterium]|nr:MarR family transcriptional regulator [Bacillota bacterium]MBQ4371770.1 MarR family transcriptional regulator [Bacillota bacterium]